MPVMATNGTENLISSIWFI